MQFRTNNNLCRRCHISLDEEPEPVVATPTAEPSQPAQPQGIQVSHAIRFLRQRSGLSQRQLALRMSVPRTYVSKIENEKATPTLSSLARLARALNVSVPELLSAGTRRQGDTAREVMADPFIAEIAPYVQQLDALQRSTFLAQIRDLVLRPRRSAQ